MARYAVNLHAKNLLLTDHEERIQFGGAWVWRIVRAQSLAEAHRVSTEEFLAALRRTDEIRNPASEPLSIVVEQTRVLGPFARGKNTAIVFYIDSDDPRNQTAPSNSP